MTDAWLALFESDGTSVRVTVSDWDAIDAAVTAYHDTQRDGPVYYTSLYGDPGWILASRIVGVQRLSIAALERHREFDAELETLGPKEWEG